MSTAVTRVVVRPFRDADYSRVVEIANLADPDHPQTEAEVRHADTAWDHDRWFRVRVVAEDGSGRVVGAGRLHHVPGEFHPDRYLVWIETDPADQRRGVGSALYERLLGMAQARGARALQAWVRRETDADTLRFLLRRGFVEVQRGWESRLDVEAVDLDRFADAERRVAAQGITLTTLAAELARDGDALRRVHALHAVCRRDVPRAGEATHVPFEEFERSVLHAPHALPEACFLAVAGGPADRGAHYVGLSKLEALPAEPSVLWQGLTAVLREHRGLGIAMALKVQTVRYARAHGYREIRTDNDLRNVRMLRVNEALGFVKQPAWLTLETTP